jgi:peroxiredoxin
MIVRPLAGSRTGRAPQLLLLATCAGLAWGLASGWGVRVAAQSAAQSAAPPAAAFGKVPSFDVVVPAFTDADIARFTSTLDSQLSTRPANASSIDDAAVWDVARGLQTGRLSAAQEARVHGALMAASGRNPSSAALASRVWNMVDTLTVGKTAPEITGRDLDGAEFRLSDYRGKVVALIFSGEWCGICRTQYPYERLLLELYKNWPFAILGVDSDANRDATRKAMADRGLTYRAWWDGYLPDNTGGPIATEWDVTGWPTVYVIDPIGVIRFVDLRQEDLLKGVRQLLTDPSHSVVPTNGHNGHK